MSVFLYNRKNTPVHRLDPRVKIAMLLWSFLAAALAADLLSLGMVCVLLLIGFIIAGSTGNILKMGWMLLLIGGTTFILWVLFYRPAEGAENANVVMHAAVMTLRFIAMLLAGIFFLSVTALEDFSNGLMLLKVPYAAAFAVSLSFRLVNTFISTGFLIVEAQEARGNDATRGNIIKRVKAYAPLLVPLILNGIKKAETLNLALESKGFSPQNKPDISGRYIMKTADIAALGALAVSAVIIIFYRIFLP
jgi:energy-coupling factor transport system permease protein